MTFNKNIVQKYYESFVEKTMLTLVNLITGPVYFD